MMNGLLKVAQRNRKMIEPQPLNITLMLMKINIFER